MKTTSKMKMPSKNVDDFKNEDYLQGFEKSLKKKIVNVSLIALAIKAP